MPTTDLLIGMAGAGGDGIIAAGESLITAAAIEGYYAMLTKSFGPQIRGGESSFRLRVSDGPVYSLGGVLDVAVALNWDDFLRFGAERKTARSMIARLGIKTPSESQKVGFLSGGNQQKVSVGKWLIANADVYIFDEPTKGVDVGAKKDIFELIGGLAEAGKAVLYASCEFAEILGITDRVYVLYDGRISKELRTAETTEEELLLYSTGGK